MNRKVRESGSRSQSMDSRGDKCCSPRELPMQKRFLKNMLQDSWAWDKNPTSGLSTKLALKKCCWRGEKSPSHLFVSQRQHRGNAGGQQIKVTGAGSPPITEPGGGPCALLSNRKASTTWCDRSPREVQRSPQKWLQGSNNLQEGICSQRGRQSRNSSKM